MLRALLAFGHVNVLIKKKYVSFFLCILALHIMFYDWITIMGYSRHELNKINTLYSLKKIYYITPPPLHNGHFILSPIWL